MEKRRWAWSPALECPEPLGSSDVYTPSLSAWLQSVLMGTNMQIGRKHPYLQLDLQHLDHLEEGFSLLSLLYPAQRTTDAASRCHLRC